MTGLDGGGFVVTWQDFSQMVGDPSGRDIRGEMFDASGTAVGSEFLVNTTTTNNQLDPSVTGLAGGGFVVTWSDGVKRPGAHLAAAFAARSSTPAARQSAASSWSTRRLRMVKRNQA